MILFVSRKVLSVFITLATHFTSLNFTVPHYVYVQLYWKNKVKLKLRLSDDDLSEYNYMQNQSVQNHQNMHVCTQNILHKI